MDKQAIEVKIAALELSMAEPDFWADKVKAQAAIKELQELKDRLSGVGKYDRGDAVLTFLAGAGGDDAEDFVAMLFSMYRKYAERQGWTLSLVYENPNDHGGYRNLAVEVSGKNVYGTLKGEAGVHRLVRISPFGAKELRQTSFAMVEVTPKLDRASAFEVPESELEITFARSSGPGGQNVNKRETAARVVHLPTKLSVHADGERSQAQNKEKAIEILKGKLYKLREEERMAKEKGMYLSKTTSVEWGNQIRSYVMHPYKMVKDHRTDAETAQIDKVLAGDIDLFIEAEKGLTV